MKHWKEKILQMKFGGVVKRLVVLSICVVLLGGGLAAALLRPQISQIASAMQQVEQREGPREERFHGWEGRDDPYGITEPALPVKAALLMIEAAFCALLAVWWLLVPAWLYQASKRARMNTLLWPLLGVVWSLWGTRLFLVVRSLLCQRCGTCGTWQRRASFCRTCGTSFQVACPSCGTACSPGDQYCNHCGAHLNAAEAAREDG